MIYPYIYGLLKIKCEQISIIQRLQSFQKAL